MFCNTDTHKTCMNCRLVPHLVKKHRRKRKNDRPSFTEILFNIQCLNGVHTKFKIDLRETLQWVQVISFLLGKRCVGRWRLLLKKQERRRKLEDHSQTLPVIPSIYLWVSLKIKWTDRQVRTTFKFFLCLTWKHIFTCLFLFYCM